MRNFEIACCSRNSLFYLSVDRHEIGSGHIADAGVVTVNQVFDLVRSRLGLLRQFADFFSHHS